MMIRPEPQIPLGRTLPMVMIMGSKVAGSMEKSSMAPLAARMPNLMPPPSKGRTGRTGGAGQPVPVADDDLRIGADVHEQGQPVVRYMPDPMTPATMSPPT